MITFSDLQTLKAIVDRLAIVKPKEAYSAYGSIKIEQIDTRVTAFTTCEPSKGTFIEYYHHTNSNSFGIENTVFMVDYIEFQKLVTKLVNIAQKCITLKEEKGQLVIYTDGYYIDDELHYKFCNTLRLFTQQDRFKILESLSEKELIALAPGQDFVSFVKTAHRFGKYDDKSGRADVSLTRTIVFSLKNSLLTAYASNKNARTLTLKLDLNVTQKETTEDYLFAIEGRQMTKLFGLTDGTVQIMLNDNFVMFSNSKSEVILSLQSLPAPFIKTSLPLLEGQELEIVSERYCNIYSLYAAVVNQENSDLESGTQLLIRDEDSQLIVSSISRLLNIDEARVLLDLSMDNNGDFALCGYHFKDLEKALDTLKNYLNFKRKDNISHLIHLRQEIKSHLIDSEQVIIWFLRLCLVQDPNISILYRPNDPNYVINKINEAS